jgi:hypothetical protein
MEPVKMKAPMPQIDTPSSQEELHETLDETPSQEAAEPKAEVKAGGRKRRRASSSGIITA